MAEQKTYVAGRFPQGRSFCFLATYTGRQKSCCHLEWLCPCREIALPALVMCPDSSLVWFISWTWKSCFSECSPLIIIFSRAYPAQNTGHEPQIPVPMVYFKDSTCASGMNLKSVNLKTSCCVKVSLWQTDSSKTGPFVANHRAELAMLSLMVYVFCHHPSSHTRNQDKVPFQRPLCEDVCSIIYLKHNHRPVSHYRSTWRPSLYLHLEW